jgi:hypothetical protein
MGKLYVVTGRRSNGRVVELDEPVPLADAKVRVRIEPLLTPSARSYAEVMGDLRRRQSERGHVAPTRDEVDGYLRAERESWGE